MNTILNYRVVTSTNPQELTTKVQELINDGWQPIGGHSVVESRHINRFSGSQHKDTIINTEYSQTIVKFSDEIH